MSSFMSLFWRSLTVSERLDLVLFVYFSLSENIIYCACRQWYSTHCQRWYMNYLAITCRVNMNLLIVRRYLLTSLPAADGAAVRTGTNINSKLQKLPCFISLQHRVLWDLLAECRVVVWQLFSSVESWQKLLVSIGPVVPAGLSAGAAPWAPGRAVPGLGLAPAAPGALCGRAGAPSAREMCSVVNCR